MPQHSVTPWANIAQVTRTQGTRGEVAVVPIADLPPLVVPGLRVTLTPPSLRGVRTTTVVATRPAPHGLYVRFEDVDTIDEAHELVGKLLLARKSDLDIDLADASFACARHREVVDRAHGPLGRITDVIESAAHDIWVVSGPYGEVMIPVVPEIVVDVPDDEASPIRVEVPDGLVELGRDNAVGGGEDAR